MAETHELRLKINAAAAKSGAREFTSAINSIKTAMTGLQKTSTGAFAKFGPDPKRVEESARSTERLSQSTDKAAIASKRMSLATASAMRTSQNEAANLSKRLSRLGDTAGIDRLNADLVTLQRNLAKASTPLDIRTSRSSFADSSADAKRRAIATEAEARATREASQAASAHANRLEALRSKYNPLYASSKAYERALEEISAAERAGVLSANMAGQARERAAKQLMTATAATDQYSGALQRNRAMTQQGIMVGHQLTDILVVSQQNFQSIGTILLQQGGQLASQMNALKASGGNVFKTLLSGFTSLINPLSLITLAAVGAGAAIAKWFFAAGEESRDFGEALGDVNGQISNLRSATDALSAGSLQQLRSEYGAVNAELDAHLERLRQIAEIEAASANSDLIANIRNSLVSDGNLLTGDIDAIRRAFDTTNDQAREFLGLMRDVETAQTFAEQAAAVTRLREAVESTVGGLDNAEGSAKGVLAQLIKSEDAALRLLAAQNGVTDATYAGSSAASSLTYTLGTAADEAARLLANLGSVPSALAVMGRSVQAQIGQIQAQNRSLNIQLSEGLTAAASNRRVQLEDVVNAAGERGGNIHFDTLAATYKEIEKLDALGKDQKDLRAKIAEANRPAKQARKPGGGGGGKGGGRAAQLTEEAQAVENLTKSLNDRITSLDEEARAMQLVASGMFENESAAQLYAKAQTVLGGAVDSGTESLIRQIDAAETLNESLKRMAKDPVNDWMKSVPLWREAGQMIERDVFDSLSNSISEMIQTGKFDFESLGQAILGTIADVVADKATKELATLFGANTSGKGEGGFGLGGMLSDLFGNGGSMGDAPDPLAAGGDQSALMQNAMVTGGQTAAQSIQTAMTQAGQQVGQQITSGGAQAGTQMRTSVTTGGAVAGSQMSSSVNTSGAVAGQRMNSEIQRGGSMAAQRMGQAVASGGSGGGIGGLFGGGGGLGSLLPMVLGGIFAEGGNSSSPVASTMMPVSAFRHSPSYSDGVANTSGIPALLHDNEAVIPLTRGRKVPVEMGGDMGMAAGAKVFNQTLNIQTPDADSFRKSRDQIANETASMGRRAMAKNG